MLGQNVCYLVFLYLLPTHLLIQPARNICPTSQSPIYTASQPANELAFPCTHLVDASAVGAVDGAAGAGLDAAHEGQQVFAGAQFP